MFRIVKLHNELASAGVRLNGVRAVTETLDGVTDQIEVDYTPEATQDDVDLAAQIMAVHDPTDYVSMIMAAAEAQAQAVPQWAGWTMAEAAAWWQANVQSLIDAIPDINGLTPAEFQANAKAIVAQQQAIIIMFGEVIQRLGQLDIALRNRVFPGLEGS